MTTERFERELRRARPMLYRYALRLTRNTETAEDVLARSVIHGLKYCDRFEERSTFETWMCMIIRQRTIEHIRQAKKRREVSLEMLSLQTQQLFDYEIPDHAMSGEAIQKLIEQEETALAILEAAHWRDRNMFIEKAMGCSNAELAASAGVPEGTIKSRLNRATSVLRNILCPA